MSSVIGGNLMEKQGRQGNQSKGAEGGGYARADAELYTDLYKKAIGILDKCRIETRD